MSAWLCSDVHLSALTQAVVVERLAPMHQADMIWQRAKWQNLYALAVRYGDPLGVYLEDDTIVETPEFSDVPLDRTSVEAELHPAKVYDLYRCWNYQCAEFTGYDKTDISVLMDRLGQHLVAKHPEFFIEHPDGDGGVYYDTKLDTTWGITDWDEVIWSSEPDRAVRTEP